MCALHSGPLFSYNCLGAESEIQTPRIESGTPAQSERATMRERAVCVYPARVRAQRQSCRCYATAIPSNPFFPPSD